MATQKQDGVSSAKSPMGSANAKTPIREAYEDEFKSIEQVLRYSRKQYEAGRQEGFLRRLTRLMTF